MSKVTRPILVGIYPRKRLFSLLNQMRKQPVIWVCGPPGCGKTTLVSSYIEARKIPCLWYQVDQGDADIATFFYYMGLAAKKAVPRKRKPLPLLTPEYLQGISTFTFRYFEELYSRLIPLSPPFNPPSPSLVKGGKGGFIIVFDNYQEVPTSSPFHEIILNGLSRIPEMINVILISRSDPPPALIRLHANHQMEMLGWNELRLTPEESSAIVRLRSKQKVPKETIQHLHKTVDGWTAGLVLMLEGIKRGTEPHLLPNPSSAEIIDYFGNVLFDRTDREIQDFLLKTAFLPKMTIRMAEELTGISHAGRIFSTLSRNNYFIEKRFDKEPSYQYHPLFRDFLLTRAKETFPPETLSVLISRTALLLEEAGETEAAAHLFRDGGYWQHLIQLILKHVPPMVTQGRYRTLKDWLDDLPKDLFNNNPWLLYWAGECYFYFDISQSQICFKKGFKIFRNQKDIAGIFLAWSGVVKSIIASLEDFKPLDYWISVLENLMLEFKVFPSEEIGLCAASFMFQALVFRQPQHPEIEIWAERVLSFVEASSNISMKMQALYLLAYYWTSTIGNFQKAIFALNLLRKLAQSPDAPPSALIRVRFAETIYYRYTGQHEECIKAASEALDVSINTGIHFFDYLVLFNEISSFLNVNDFAGAGKLLNKIDLSSSRLRPWEARYYHSMKAREALLRGDLEQASLHSEMAMKFSTDVGAPLSSIASHLLKAHLLHRLEKRREAAENLFQASCIARKMRSRLYEFFILLAEASFALGQGDESSCLTALQKALTMGREEGYFYTYFDYPSEMARLCAKACEAGIEVAYVQDLIKRLNIIPEKLSLYLENWPWPLKIYTLGRFEIIKDGKPIRFSGKVQKKPLSLLKALIALGGRDVREDRIADLLWPESDGDASHISFLTTLHRLRKLLDHEKAIQYREGRLTLNDRYCWVDVWAFEQILGQVESQWKDGLRETAVQFTEKALEMYKGPFLAEEMEQPWAISMRERLISKFLRNLSRLAHHWGEVGEWEKAVEYYEKGLEVNDLIEELYQQLMTCYQRLGRKAEALAVYHRCRKTLHAALGIEPSPKTEVIYRSLVTNR
jgi:LuxR family maltose regulon positive regulatory protein